MAQVTYAAPTSATMNSASELVAREGGGEPGSTAGVAASGHPTDGTEGRRAVTAGRRLWRIDDADRPEAEALAAVGVGGAGHIGRQIETQSRSARRLQARARRLTPAGADETTIRPRTGRQART
jgi:hypothetical protein